MNSLNKNNLPKGPVGVYSWAKHKIIQTLGVLLFLFSLFLWFSFYCFDFQDYGNPYLSSSKEDIHLFYFLGSWFNGAITYWIGKTCWILPVLPLILGYRLFNGIQIKYLIFKIIELSKLQYVEIISELSSAWSIFYILIFTILGLFHMRQGVNEIMEDYVHSQNFKKVFKFSISIFVFGILTFVCLSLLLILMV